MQAGEHRFSHLRASSVHVVQQSEIPFIIKQKAGCSNAKFEITWEDRLLALAIFSPEKDNLGYLDDLILIPLGVALALKMIPSAVIQQCTLKAEERIEAWKPKNWLAGSLIIMVWHDSSMLVTIRQKQLTITFLSIKDSTI
jgi:hypothetical protein